MSYRDPNLLRLAQLEPCLFRIPGICTEDHTTVVAAHSNELAHDKGKSIKAPDFMSAWACHACHMAYDQGDYDEAVKKGWFAQAHVRQLGAWSEIATCGTRRQRNVTSATNALIAYAAWAAAARP
jgi:hypothetical protein